jgi:integrase
VREIVARNHNLYSVFSATVSFLIKEENREMDYIDWFLKVLTQIVEASRATLQARQFGVSVDEVAKGLLGADVVEQPGLQRKGDDPDERLFTSASVNLRKVWEAARREAGLTSVRFHDLRQTFATRMADAGMERQELAKIFGHTDISMTYR